MNKKDQSSSDVYLFILYSLYDTGLYTFANQKALFWEREGVKPLQVRLITALFRSEKTSPFVTQPTEIPLLDSWTQDWVTSRLVEIRDRRIAIPLLKAYEEKWGRDNRYFALSYLHGVDEENSLKNLFRNSPVPDWQLLLAVQDKLPHSLVVPFKNWFREYDTTLWTPVSFDGKKGYPVEVQKGQLSKVDYPLGEGDTISFDLAQGEVKWQKGPMTQTLFYANYPYLSHYTIESDELSREYFLQEGSLALPFPAVDIPLFDLESLKSEEFPSESNLLEHVYFVEESERGRVTRRYHFSPTSGLYLVESNPEEESLGFGQWAIRDWEVQGGRLDLNGDGIFDVYEHYTDGRQDGVLYAEEGMKSVSQIYKRLRSTFDIRTWGERRKEYLDAWQVTLPSGERRSSSGDVFTSIDKDTLIPWSLEDINNLFLFDDVKSSSP